MTLSMPSPSKHPKTGVYQLRQRVPSPLREHAKGQVITVKVAERVSRIKVGAEVKVSLGTKEAGLAKERANEVQTQLNAYWASLTALPTKLNHRQIVALSGEAYNAFKGMEDDPGSPELWARVQQLNLDAIEGRNLYIGKRYGLRRRFGPFVDWALERHKLRVDAPTYEALLDHFAKALTEVVDLLERRASGDYSQDRVGERFPPVELPAATPPAEPAKPRTFTDIIGAEKSRRELGRDAKPMPEETVRKYTSIATQFAKFRGSSGEDAATVTSGDLEAWKLALMTDGEIGNRTVAYKLGAIKTVIGWGKRHFKADMTKAAKELEEVDLPDFERKPSDLSAIHPDEAVVILSAARRETDDPRKRWLPWLCAYTGLRISEANRLETTDFFESEGLWFFEVSSSGKRSLKTINARRTIPVHPALIKEGFRTFVGSAPKGRLFKSGADSLILKWFHGPAVGIKRPGVSPNHGWRHLFEDLCRRYQLTDDARHYLTGHATGGADQMYGRTRVMLPGLWKEMAKIEPFVVPPEPVRDGGAAGGKARS